jgi:hypothetical protein
MAGFLKRSSADVRRIKRQSLRGFRHQYTAPRPLYGGLKRAAQKKPCIAYVESVRLNPGATDLDQAAVIAGLEARGYEVDVIKWDDRAPIDWKQYSLVLHGSPWSNWRNMPKYLAFVKHLKSLGVKQVNPPDILRKGSSKEYLLELAEEGVNIIPTKLIRYDAAARKRYLRSVSINGKSPLGHKRVRQRFPGPKTGDIEELFTVDGELCDEIVIKPSTAGGAGGAARYRRADQGLAAFRRVQEMQIFEQRDVIVEPYISAVEGKRELSQIITRGKLTHASTKPHLLGPDEAPGALRQSHPDKRPYTSTPDEEAFAEQVWDAMKRRYGLSDSDDISIRVDSIDGKLLEIELIAPVKSFDAVGGAGLDEFLDMIIGTANHEFAIRRLGFDQYETISGGFEPGYGVALEA